MPFWEEVVLQISTHRTKCNGIAFLNFIFSFMPLDISLSKLTNSKFASKSRHLKIILVLELRNEPFEKIAHLFCPDNSNN